MVPTPPTSQPMGGGSGSKEKEIVRVPVPVGVGADPYEELDFVG